MPVTLDEKEEVVVELTSTPTFFDDDVAVIAGIATSFDKSEEVVVEVTAWFTGEDDDTVVDVVLTLAF